MKKSYMKPMAMIESFDLSQHIAACAEPIKNKNSVVTEGCSADIPSIGATNIFYWGVVGNMCESDGEEMYCYTKGGSGNFVFSS